jgi:iron complex transport system substrate-binding protein
MRHRIVIGLAAIVIAIPACSSDDATDDAAIATAVLPSDPAPPPTEATTAPTATSPTTTAAVDRGPGPAPLTIPAGMGSAQGAGVFPRTVTHFMGETVVEADPQRIIVIGTGQLDVMLTLGLMPVGAVQRDGAAIVQPYLVESYPELADQLAAVVSVGTNSAVNYEAIAALQPDLILDNGGAEAEGADLLAAIAPTVITAGTGVNWKQDFLLIASAVGRSDVAEQFMQDYDARAGAMAASVAGDPPTASFVRFNVARARMFGVPSFAGSIAWDAGIDRPVSQQFDSTSEDLSEEQIALIDADWIFYSIQGAPDETPADLFTSSPLWATLAAIEGGHVTVVPDDPWYLSAGPTAATIVLDGLIETFGS